MLHSVSSLVFVISNFAILMCISQHYENEDKLKGIHEIMKLFSSLSLAVEECSRLMEKESKSMATRKGFRKERVECSVE